jgi:hypothetical protein
MAALVLIIAVAAVPTAIALSIWSNVGSVHEAMEKRKLDASNLGLPGDYHRLYDQAHADDWELFDHCFFRWLITTLLVGRFMTSTVSPESFRGVDEQENLKWQQVIQALPPSGQVAF